MFSALLVELGLVAVEAVGAKRAVTQFIEFQRCDGRWPWPGAGRGRSVAVEGISLFVTDRFQDYEPDDANLTPASSR